MKNKLILTLPLVALCLGSTAHAQVWLNEFHYDNTGTDTGEAIEILVQDGFDISNVVIELVNGSNGTVYNSVNGGFTAGASLAGFGTLYTINFPSNGIQNGAPDGIALAYGGSLVQFLSYEGSFSANAGFANGISSTDIGVSQTSSTPIGFSLQLTGTGSSYSDFTWASEAASTFGSFNTDQTPIPEPSTYAAIFGALALVGAFIYRRRK